MRRGEFQAPDRVHLHANSGSTDAVLIGSGFYTKSPSDGMYVHTSGEQSSIAEIGFVDSLRAATTVSKHGDRFTAHDGGIVSVVRVESHRIHSVDRKITDESGSTYRESYVLSRFGQALSIEAPPASVVREFAPG